jgi:gp16 family phage-associated protein
MAGCIVCHGFKNAADRFLVVLWNASVLTDQAIFDLGKRLMGQCFPSALNDICNIKIKQLSGEAKVRGGSITSTRFIVALGAFRDAKFFGQLVLSQTSVSAEFTQPDANLFGESQYFSTRIFTLAVFCHILRSSSHENAEICTMPNTSITEQARKKARDALEKRGQSAKNFAVQHDLTPSTVYAVLNGQSQCRRGEAHRAAVLLGIKDGVIEQ